MDLLFERNYNFPYDYNQILYLINETSWKIVINSHYPE